MNLPFLQSLGARRRVSLWRVVGPGAWLSIALWSALAVTVLGASRDPEFISRLTTAGSVGDALGVLFGVVSPLLLPLVVAGVAIPVVALRLVREVRRAFGLGRRRSHTDHDAVDDVDGFLGGGLLGGALSGGFGDAFDGDDGDE